LAEVLHCDGRGKIPRALAACDWRKPGCSAINLPKLAFSHRVLWRRAGRTAALEIDQCDNACVGCGASVRRPARRLSMPQLCSGMRQLDLEVASQLHTTPLPSLTPPTTHLYHNGCHGRLIVNRRSDRQNHALVQFETGIEPIALNDFELLRID